MNKSTAKTSALIFAFVEIAVNIYIMKFISPTFSPDKSMIITITATIANAFWIFLILQIIKNKMLSH